MNSFLLHNGFLVLLLVIGVAALVAPITAQEQAVNIPDATLRAKIETALKKAAGAPITTAEMSALTTLDASDTNTRDLTGLQNATNLQTLYLQNTDVSDIAPLATLTKLQYLYLENTDVSNLTHLQGFTTNLLWLDISGTDVSDLSPLKGLTNLELLRFTDTGVSDLSPLKGLTNLWDLFFDRTSVSDLSPLQALTNLQALGFYSTSVSDISLLSRFTKLSHLAFSRANISDISVFQGLTNLEELFLHDMPILDLAPLVANTGLGSGDWIKLGGCDQLNYRSIYEHIPALQARGAKVEFENRTPTTLLKISGDNQNGNPSTTLKNPFVVEVQDQNKEPFEGVPITFTVTAGGGTLTDPTSRTDTNGRCQTTLTLGTGVIKNTVEVAAAQITQKAIFTATLTVSAEDIDRDGDVDIDDLVAVATNFGRSTARATNPNTDINGDGQVDEHDLRLVVIVLEAAGLGAPPVRGQTSGDLLERWITTAKQQKHPDIDYLRGITVLEQLLDMLRIPEQTSLLPNYPNPFNPETWIPYELAIGTSVALRIYDVKGRVVRTLHLGHQAAGTYKHKSRAAYWDGRNEVGEPVASGVYFYTLLAGEIHRHRQNDNPEVTAFILGTACAARIPCFMPSTPYRTPSSIYSHINF